MSEFLLLNALLVDRTARAIAQVKDHKISSFDRQHIVPIMIVFPFLLAFLFSSGVLCANAINNDGPINLTLPATPPKSVQRSF